MQKYRKTIKQPIPIFNFHPNFAKNAVFPLLRCKLCDFIRFKLKISKNIQYVVI